MKEDMNNWRFILLVAIIPGGCKKPYNPKVTAVPYNCLVVEGFINSGADSTIIKLNRTVKLSGTTTVNPELGATVNVEGDDNTVHSLTGDAKGRYKSAGLNLSNAHKYRLRIATKENREYISDFVPVVNSPSIDSLTYKIESDGVSVNLNTHDPKSNSKYYRWEYDETWIFTSDYRSLFKSNGDTVLFRDLINDQIYMCWRTVNSSTIVLGSSAKLSQDVISNSPITFLSRHSIKIRNKYSMLVRQYALTADAYNFWENLKKNTEQLGSIFDAQPSQINGNIYAVSNTSEPVIGYVSVGTFTTKRIFIDQRTLPPWLDPIDSDDGCTVMEFLYAFNDPVSGGVINQVDMFLNYNRSSSAGYIPINGIYMIGNPVKLGFRASTPECVDCTLHGTNKQPDFWK